MEEVVPRVLQHHTPQHLGDEDIPRGEAIAVVSHDINTTVPLPLPGTHLSAWAAGIVVSAPDPIKPTPARIASSISPCDPRFLVWVSDRDYRH